MSEIDGLAAAIAERGNRRVFGITGSGPSLMLADRLERAGVEFLRTQFEGAAAMMAGTVGRLSGSAGVAVGIKGPGLANMIPGLAVAHFEAFPMVAVVEAYAPGSSPAKAHKRLDHAALVGPVSKACRPLAGDGSGFAELADLAEAETPGATVLELAGPGLPPQPPLAAAPAGPGDPAALLAMINAAERPVVIAGALAIRAGWGARLAAMPLPVFSTAAAKGVIDERLHQAAGVYTGVGLELSPERRILPQADLVVGLGLRPNEVLATVPFGCPAVNLDSAAVPGAEEFRFDQRCPAPPPGFWDALGRKRWGSDLVADSLTRLDRHMTEAGFLPARAFGVIDRAVPGARLVLDTGYFCTIGEHAWRASRPDLCLMSGQGRYMGTGVPMGLAAALHDPTTPCVTVVGDGGIGMYIGEMRLAVERGLPMLLVLMSDGRFGSIVTRAIKDGLTEKPLRPNDPSWRRILDGFGVATWRAEDDAGLAAALGEWRRTGGPGYVEIPFTPAPYEAMVAGIR